MKKRNMKELIQSIYDFANKGIVYHAKKNPLNQLQFKYITADKLDEIVLWLESCNQAALARRLESYTQDALKQLKIFDDRCSQSFESIEDRDICHQEIQGTLYRIANLLEKNSALVKTPSSWNTVGKNDMEKLPAEADPTITNFKSEKVPKSQSFINYDDQGNKIIRAYGFGRKFEMSEPISDAENEILETVKRNAVKQLKKYYPTYPFKAGLQKADGFLLYSPTAITEDFLKATGGFQMPLTAEQLALLDQTVGSRYISIIKSFLIQKCNCQNAKEFSWDEILEQLDFIKKDLRQVLNENNFRQIILPPIPVQSDPPPPEKIADVVDDLVRIPEIMSYFRIRISEYSYDLCNYRMASETRKREQEDCMRTILKDKRLRDREAGPPGEGWHWDTGWLDEHDKQGKYHEIEVSGWMPSYTVELPDDPNPWNCGNITEFSSADQWKFVRAGCWLLALCHDYYLAGKRPHIIDKAFADENPEIAVWKIPKNPDSIYEAAIRQHEPYIYPALKDVYYALEKRARTSEFSNEIIEQQSTNEIHLKGRKTKQKKSQTKKQSAFQPWRYPGDACFIIDDERVKFHTDGKIKDLKLRNGSKAHRLLKFLQQGSLPAKELKEMCTEKTRPSDIAKQTNQVLNKKIKMVGFLSVPSNVKFISFNSSSNQYETTLMIHPSLQAFNRSELRQPLIDDRRLKNVPDE